MRRCSPNGEACGLIAGDTGRGRPAQAARPALRLGRSAGFAGLRRERRPARPREQRQAGVWGMAEGTWRLGGAGGDAGDSPGSTEGLGLRDWRICPRKHLPRTVWLSRDTRGSRAQDGDAQNSEKAVQVSGRRPRPGQCLCRLPGLWPGPKGAFSLSPRLSPPSFLLVLTQLSLHLGHPLPNLQPRCTPASPSSSSSLGSPYPRKAGSLACPATSCASSPCREGALCSFPQMVAQGTDLNLSS